jgi:hypothetical protein
MSWCRSCGREIRWVVTVMGVQMPIDPAPQDDGNVVFMSTGRVRTVADDERSRYPGPVYKNHYASCPNQPEHRRPHA